MLTIRNQVQPTKYTLMDSFYRANNNTSLGVSKTGQSWVSDVGVWGIEGEMARVFSVDPPTAVAIASIEANLTSKAIVSARFIFAGEYIDQRILFRHVDAANHLFIRSQATRYEIYRRVSGAITNIGNINITPLNGDKIEVRIKGTEYTFFINGVNQLIITESAYSASTKIALSQYTNNYPGNSSRFDDIKVVKL